jgi:hypothetical protein
MKQNIDSNFTQFSTPSQAAPRGASGQGAVATGMRAAEPDPGARAAGGPAKRGRPSDYAPRVIDMLCDSIRRYGLSDSAAAEQQGMSTSTLSRWKQVHPEIGIKLKQARQQIRTFHLDRIMEHSAAENGKGWRASAWILERLFPGDYSPRMKERNAYLNLEERLLDKEAHEALDEQLRELHEKQAEERAAQAAAQAAEAAGSVGVSPASAMNGPLRGTLGGTPRLRMRRRSWHPPLKAIPIIPEMQARRSQSTSRNAPAPKLRRSRKKKPRSEGTLRLRSGPVAQAPWTKRRPRKDRAFTMWAIPEIPEIQARWRRWTARL